MVHVTYPFENLQTGMTAETTTDFKNTVRSILQNACYLEDQNRNEIFDAAFKTLAYPAVSEKARQAIENGIICLINEGPAPYHPRYVAPDFAKLLEEGSRFFDLPPAQDLYQAITSLITVYQYSPTSDEPPFIGRLDRLLEPYLDTVTENTAIPLLKTFWVLVDRLHPNAFVHAVIGPQRTRLGEMLLEIEPQCRTVTNLTLLYDPAVTDKDFALRAVINSFELAKPYFMNHRLQVRDWGENYVVASCYNLFPASGGIFTLVRLNLKQMVKAHDCNYRQLLDEVIPEMARLQVEVINSRIRHLMDEIEWFDHNIYVKEGLLDAEKFTAYAGIFGLHEAVELIMEKMGRAGARYGNDSEANDIACQLVQRLKSELYAIPALYCKGSQGHVTLHAQVGISTDVDVTPGVRVRSGYEPQLYEHLQVEARLQSLVEGGASTILEFDQTARSNPQAVLDIINVARQTGLRDLTFGCANSEFIRVSGYLVRRCDVEGRAQECLKRHVTSDFAIQFFANQPEHLHRRMQKV